MKTGKLRFTLGAFFALVRTASVFIAATMLWG
jgi:hypothetical protein